MVPTLTDIVELNDPRVGTPLSKRVTAKYRLIKNSAKKRGKEFSLSRVTIARLLLKERCAYLGTPFEKEGDMVRTFERVDENKGYVEGNVIAVSYLANSLKNHLLEKKHGKCKITIEQLIQFTYSIYTGETE